MIFPEEFPGSSVHRPATERTSPLLVQLLVRIAVAMLIQIAIFRIAFHPLSQFRGAVVQAAAARLFVDVHLLFDVYHHFPAGRNINRIKRLPEMPLQPLIGFAYGF